MHHNFVPEKNKNARRLRPVFVYFTRPQVILFLVVLFNFVWYFSQSSTVQHFGSKTITFCVVCAWYWDWSITNPPSLLLFAAFCVLFRGWKGYLIALLVSTYVVGQGIIWVSRGSGLIRGVQQRIEAISENDVLPTWMAPDWQYVFAVIFSAILLAYLIREIRDLRHLS